MLRCCTPNAYRPLDRDDPLNIAEQIIDWLYTDQLQIDEQWSYLLPTGFTWWADEYAQTVEMVREQTGPRGETGYLIAVRTELLRDVDLTDPALAAINALPMRCASLSGPVYDTAARRLDLWSLVRVHDDNAGWMRHLLAAAAVTQLADARLLAPVLAEAAGALRADSDHPQSGRRTEPDEMSFAAGVFVRSGEQPSAWTAEEFAAAAARCTGQTSAVAAASDPHGLTVTFGHGETTSTCRMRSDQPHPVYGAGLLVLQSFPVDVAAESDGVRLALSLNAADLTAELTGYGLGSYAYSDGMMHFTTFIPNALHKNGLLNNLMSSCSARVQGATARLLDGYWDADAYSVDAAVLARWRERQWAAAPAAPPPMRGCPMMRANAGGR